MPADFMFFQFTDRATLEDNKKSSCVLQQEQEDMPIMEPTQSEVGMTDPGDCPGLLIPQHLELSLPRTSDKSCQWRQDATLPWV